MKGMIIIEDKEEVIEENFSNNENWPLFTGGWMFQFFAQICLISYRSTQNHEISANTEYCICAYFVVLSERPN
jgi:hypothetical protein